MATCPAGERPDPPPGVDIAGRNHERLPEKLAEVAADDLYNSLKSQP